MALKQVHNNSSEEKKSKDRNKSTTTATAISKKKFTGLKIYKISFKNEWKASYPITQMKHDKYIQVSLPPLWKELNLPPPWFERCKRAL